jgi:hypothetical protein
MSRRTVIWGSVILLGVALGVGVYLLATPPTVLEIQPREVTPEERQYAAGELSANVRKGLSGSEADAADQLGLLIWAFDFKGGPFGCWIDFEETGQQTATSPMPRKYPNMLLTCDGKEGTLLLWLQPRTTPQMPQQLKDRFLRNEPQIPDLSIGMDSSGHKALRMADYEKPSGAITPLWFGWKEAGVKEHLSPATLKPEQTATILLIEATEKNTSNPRQVKLILTARK